MKVHRLAEVEDVSGVICFLASKDADYVNGEIIMITGTCSPRLWKEFYNFNFSIESHIKIKNIIQNVKILNNYNIKIN